MDTNICEEFLPVWMLQDNLHITYITIIGQVLICKLPLNKLIETDKIDAILQTFLN